MSHDFAKKPASGKPRQRKSSTAAKPRRTSKAGASKQPNSPPPPWLWLVAGIFIGILISFLAQLATMPSREELLAKLLGTMQAPIAKFVQTLNEVPTKFVRGLAAVRDDKEKQAA